MTECLRVIALLLAIFAVIVIVAVALRARGVREAEFLSEDLEDWYQ